MFVPLAPGQPKFGPAKKSSEELLAAAAAVVAAVVSG